MAEQKKKAINISRTSVSVAKKAPKPIKKPLPTVVKNTTPAREEKKKKTKVVNKPAPNPEGINQHTPSSKWYGDSYADTKVKLKVYLEFNSVEHMRFIENLVKDANNGDPTARKLVVGMTGGEDPKETRDVTERTIPNPFENLTEEELRKLAGRK